MLDSKHSSPVLCSAVTDAAVRPICGGYTPSRADGARPQSARVHPCVPTRRDLASVSRWMLLCGCRRAAALRFVGSLYCTPPRPSPLLPPLFLLPPPALLVRHVLLHCVYRVLLRDSSFAPRPLGSGTGSSGSGEGSHASTDSSLLREHFPQRYFILKSLTRLDLGVNTGLWATQKHNEGVLDRAFRTSKDVFLIFSVNQSTEFYGYARMAGLIGQSESSQGRVTWARRGSGSSLSNPDSPIDFRPPVIASEPLPPADPSSFDTALTRRRCPHLRKHVPPSSAPSVLLENRHAPRDTQSSSMRALRSALGACSGYSGPNCCCLAY
uniref:YTH domain-containing protein n=1 Tax=Mycena chlorophos TaxID=658473 RepID=A0ABQ0L394_MYCCL|nr:predicted protein [Mycena chlorophos]